jgi:o-succinylbenzoate synthase
MIRTEVRLVSAELRRIRLPLVTPFRTSFGTQTEREALLVRLVTSAGEGWGECVALKEPLYSSEYVDGAEHVICDHLLPRLFREQALTPSGVGTELADVVGHRMAKAALEMAALDAVLRAEGVSLGRYMGAERETIDCGVSVGIHDSIASLLTAVEAYLDQGYRRVKLKIEPGWDLELVRAVRERFGDLLPLQVDANTAYAPEDTDQLERLDEFGLLLLEQPFSSEQLLAHAELARRIDTPVCLDESITSLQTAADAIALGACEVCNIKPGRVGGYLEAVRIHDLCRARNVPVWCGGMLETGLGRAANIALAALPGFTLPGDVSAS